MIAGRMVCPRLLLQVVADGETARGAVRSGPAAAEVIAATPYTSSGAMIRRAAGVKTEAIPTRPCRKGSP